jgi:hypothetical protein
MNPGGEKDCPSSNVLPAGTTAATTTAAPITAAATSAAAPPAAEAATSTACRLGSGFINVHGSSVQLRAIQLLDGGLGFAAIGHLDESKAARLASVTVGYDIDALDSAVLRESCEQVVLRGLKIEVPHKNIGHEM